ncbi:SDR family NAD(P)-dependent oxidoreductase [Streptomyces sp. NPDC050400]|uniref:SDR family NAD(P)-dependent oxidoreductase n=1 Tax=Streptomyces sp. NPDC050400 TaxID=3365610 RepID=UPI0037A04041
MTNDNDKVASYLRRATLDLRAARQRIQELEADPIAIVGTACRLPGGIDTPEGFWDVLAAGEERLSRFPDDRGWDLTGLYHPDPDHPGTTYVRTGGFLERAGDFDAAFFGISPREAAAMDPQQRLLLETCWELVENAGLDPHALRGTETGVFLGVARHGYGDAAGSAEDAEGYTVTGVAPSVASGRIAYTLGLEGPAITLDTACSSSLVALHLAVASLRRGECATAIVGGAAVMAGPEVFIDFARQRALAADGRSKAFGATADGFGFGEGVAVLLLERLSDARRNGHTVHAVVHGTGINQDGASNGLSAPSRAAQRKVIEQALANAGIAPGDVDAVEAHGTGTTLGDPIEAHALLDTYGRHRDARRPLWLGSAKSNIGHTQGAAGAVGILKMVLALRHERLPRTLHAQEPSPHVDWSSGAVALLAEEQHWPRGDRPRYAAVSAFGISGTNAHVVLGEAPEAQAAEPPETGTPASTPHGPVPLVVSARTDEALRAQARRLSAVVADETVQLADLGLSLAVDRARHEHRAVVLAGTREAAALGIGEVADGRARIRGTVESGGRSAVFLFPGQGSQWAGMGADLLEWSPVFAESIRACDAAMAPWQDWSVAAVLRQEPGAPGLDRVDVVQPALFAVMVSLAALWRSYGVEPAAVAGHSQGEIAAAHVAGILTLEDAARLIVLRSRLLRSVAGQGAMAAVALDETAVRELIAPYGGAVEVAAVNGPAAVVVSGEPDAVHALVAACAEQGVRARAIDVDYASHSAQMDQVRDELADATRELKPGRAQVAFYSTVTGRPMRGEELDASYWYRNLREPVRLHDVVELAAAAHHDAFLEISPHPVLAATVEETLDARGREPGDSVVVGTLRRAAPGPESFLASLASAHVAGVDVRWQPAFPGARHVPLPTYPFQRKHYWTSVAAPARGAGDVTYGEAWQPLPAQGRTEPDGAGGTWLVVTPPTAPAFAAPLTAALREAGGTPLTCVLDPDQDRAAATAAVTAATAGSTALRGVVSLLAADESDHRGLTGVPAGAVATLTLLQALGDAGVEAPLWCLTQGAARTPADDAATGSFAQAAVHGLGRVAGLELGQRWGGVLDLPPGAVAEPLVARVPGILAGAPAAEDQLALRDDHVYGRRLVRTALPAGAEPAPRPHGTVVVTGADSPIGQRLARWAADAGAGHLVLVGEADEELIGALRDGGTTVTRCTAGEDALRAAVEAAPHAVSTVLHAATRTQFGPVLETDPEDFAATVHAKTGPALTLARVLAGQPVEQEIHCSSVAGVWGGAGMAGYAAGSACLDAFAAHRRAAGHPSVAVAWSPWALPDAPEVPGALEVPGAPDAARPVAQRGLRALTADRALTVLESVLDARATAVAVSDVDWPAFAAGRRAVRPTALFAEIAEARETPEPAAPATGPDSGPAGELAAKLTALSPAEQEDLLVGVVAEATAAVLGHDSAHDVNGRRAFTELGLDSLGTVQLRKRLAAATGMRLPASLVFDHPTVTRLARHLLSLLATGPRPDDPAGATTGTAPLAEQEPIAVVGMGCRFPGGIASPDDLWRAVADGRDLTGGLPRDRGWDLAALVHPDPDHPGTSYSDRGGFLTDAAGFDADFFGITPREALAMDPQQRLMLEVAWEAVERGGIDPDQLRGSRVGVFVGSNGQSYMPLLESEAARVEGYQGLGNSASVLSGRLAYVFGWQGPALTVDTACSSSLVGIHLAIRALRSGECTMALAGGVTVISDPYTFVDFSRQRGLAADGRCKPFAAGADGFGLAEGAGALLLEPLSKALESGHPVLAVLRGSAVNQDGASNGLAAPNGPAQEAVIRQALADARLSAADVDAVEAHGTGTRLGDPIEAGALQATYGKDRQRPLALGSVKSNIGHTQAAAGVAGVIKTVLALRHGVLPSSLHAEELSPEIDWSAGTVEVQRENADWPRGPRVRRAGVSSFGVSGTNAHVLVEEAPDAPAPDAADPDRLPAGHGLAADSVALPLAARTPAALAAQARELAQLLRTAPQIPLADTARTLAAGRARFDVRAGVVGDDRAALCAALDALAAGEAAGDVVPPRTAADRRAVLVFPGQGSQWDGMARDLLDRSEVFAASMEQCATALAPYTDWDLLATLRGAGPEDAYERPDVVQPLLFAVMVSLARLWQAHGVQPAAVVGHSQGEIAAACVAGALTLDTAAKVVALRSKVLRALDGQGGMASVTGAPDEIEAALAPWDGRLSVAAVNGPRSLVVAGEATALDAFVRSPRAEGLSPRRIAVGYGSHSPQVERIERQLADELGTIEARSAAVPFFSTVTGDLLDTAGLDAAYWYRNLRGTVRLDDAVRQSTAQGFDTFVEVSPHPVLLPGIQGTADDLGRDDVVTLASLRRDRPGPRTFLRGLLEARAAGLPVDLTPATGPGGTATGLPTYPFEHTAYWPRPRRARGDAAALGMDPVAHPVLSTALETPDGGHVLTGRIVLGNQPWLADHAVGGRTLLPGSALVDLALTAGRHAGTPAVEELVLSAPLELGPATAVRVTVGAADPNGTRTVDVHARDAGGPDTPWTRHATGVLGEAAAPPEAPAAWPPPDARPLDVDAAYARLADRGYAYGPAFRALRAAWQRGDEVFAEAELPAAAGPDGTGDAGYPLHPVLLDAAAQTLGLSSLADREGSFLPFSWSGTTLYASGATAVRVTAVPADGAAMSLTVTDPTGAPVAQVGAVTVRPAGGAPRHGDAEEAGADDLYRLSWRPLPRTDDAVARCATVGGGLPGLGKDHPDLAALDAAVATGEPEPDAVFVRCLPWRADDPAGSVRESVLHAAGLVRAWLDAPQRTGRLVFLTRHAVAAGPADTAADPAQAAVWGLVRSAQAESPGTFALVDCTADPAALVRFPAVLDHPQVALRGDLALVPRLAATRGAAALLPPRTPARLEPTGSSLDALAFAAAPDAGRQPGPGEVRVELRATGVNFRDVLIALGMYPGAAVMGTEGAGVVTATGPGVTGIAVGDRVMGLFEGAFGPVAVTDHRLVVPVPRGWSSTEAAALPIVFTTAHYALHDLAGLRPGQAVLVHAAATGVGLAAVRLARLAGAEVFATASPAKHDVLRGLGLDDDHIASSREPGFGERFRSFRGGRGMDVVVNSLTGALLDESAGLLADGGAFVEMGKTDPREPDRFPGRYLPFDLADAGPDRLGAILTEIAARVADGSIGRLPVTAWPLQRASAALQHMSTGRHTGKLVLVQPAPLDPDGTVLVTGGTGTLARLLARHLVTEHGVRHLLLLGRRGPAAPGAARFEEELAALGATVTTLGCDVADRAALAAAIDGIPAEHPLTGVVHTAGVLADGLAADLRPDALAAVLAPKADAAWQLHDLTAQRELSFFALFGSGASVLAGPGQGAYAAANAALDALARHRQARGLPATSLGWGLWEEASGLTGSLDERDARRMARSGMRPLPTARALALFDLAIRRGDPVLFPLHLDTSREQEPDAVPEVLRGLLHAPLRRAAAAPTGAGLAARLAPLPRTERIAALTEAVRAQAAAVAGYDTAESVAPGRQFKDLGFDSLASVELRNRLGTAVGLRLPSTLVFDHPTPEAVAAYVDGRLFADAPGGAETDPRRPVIEHLNALEAALDGWHDSTRDAPATAETAGQRRAIEARLTALLGRWSAAGGTETGTAAGAVGVIDDADDEELFELLDQRFGEGNEGR